MNCDWVQQHLHGILDRELEEAEEAALEQHLAQCGRCEQLLRSALEEERALRSAMPPSPAPDGFAEDVMAAIEPRAASRGRLIRLWLPLSAAAAVLVVALIAHRSGADRADPPSQQTATIAATTVLSCEGDVSVLTPGEPQWVEAAPGQPLPLRAKLKTAAHAKVEVQFGDRARVMVNGNGLAEVAEAGVVLESGRAFAWVEKTGARFFIETPHARATVRGTRFNVDCRAEGKTVLSVVDGLVDFGNDSGSVEVAAHMQSVSEPGVAPAAPLLADLADAVSWVGIMGQTLGFPVDVRMRVHPAPAEIAAGVAPPAFAVDLEYGDARYAGLQLYCRVTDSDGKIVAELHEPVCARAYRYRTKRVTLPELAPGSYHASFRIGFGREAVEQVIAFEVK